MRKQESNVSAFSYKFEKRCENYEESSESKNITKLILGSDIAKKAGYYWEDIVYDSISIGNFSFIQEQETIENTKSEKSVTILDGKDPANKDNGNIITAIKNFISGKEDFSYLKQYTLYPKKGFYNKPYIGEVLDNALNIKLKPGNSDLIYLQKEENGKCIVYICDIKASLKVKLYHKIQVEIYYEFLESMLADAGLSNECIVSNQGYVWTRATVHPESFERKPIRNFLNEYLNSYDELRKEDVDIALPGEVRYMNSRKCEGCKHVDECIKKTLSNNMELILSPGISEKDVLYLAKNTDLANFRGLKKLLDDIEPYEDQNKKNKKLKKNVSEKSYALSRLRSCRYLNRMYIRNTKDYNELRDYITLWGAGTENFKLRNNIFHPDLSQTKEDINIYLSAQYEQFSNTIPVFAIGVCKKYQRRRTPDVSVFIAKDISPESIDENFGYFVSELSDILREAASKDLTIQGFVEDGIELYCIEKALFEYVNRNNADEKTRIDAALILTWIRGEKTLGAAPNVGCLNEYTPHINTENKKKDCVNTISGSVLQITEIVNRLFLIKEYISCNLENICNCIGIPFVKDSSIFNRFNGNVREVYLYKMYFDAALNVALEKSDASLVNKLEEALKDKIKAEEESIGFIRSKLTTESYDRYEKRYILDQKKKFRIPQNFINSTDSDDVEQLNESDYIDRFRYMILSEADIEKRQIRASRLQGLQEAFVKRNFIKMEYVGTFHNNKNSEVFTFSKKNDKTTQTYEVKSNGKHFLSIYNAETNDTRSSRSQSKLRYRITVEKKIKSIENEKNVIRPMNKWHLFKVDKHTKKLLRSPALVMEKNFYKYVPLWNGEFTGDNSSTEGIKVFDINYIYDRHYFWLYDEKTKARTAYIMVSGVILEEDRNQDCIVIGAYDDLNDQKLLEFLNGLKNNEYLNKITRTILDYLPDPLSLKNKENNQIKLLFEDDSDKQKAYKTFCNNKVSAVIGPPGTGKTYFISVLLKHLLTCKQNRKFRILLTSNSWAAIDNMMSALENEMKNMKEKECDLPNYTSIRLDSNRIRSRETIEEINKKETPVIIGATVWQIYNICYKKYETENENVKKFKTKCKDLRFDLIIIDEATQLRMIDALIPLSRLKSHEEDIRDDGKLIVVGDNDQLGSIIKGDYEIPDNKDNLFGAVFGYFYDKYKDISEAVSNITQLNQCRRMNEVITRYLANEIYGSDYRTVKDKSFNRLVVSSELTDKINSTSETDEPLAHILDPDYQLTVCYLECDDNDAYDINDLEIELTSDLALALQENIRDRERPEEIVDFSSFWGSDMSQNGDLKENEDSDAAWKIAEGMIGVISPYNRLNEDITDRISEKYENIKEDLKSTLGIKNWNIERISDNIRCSTVDKFQGQEKDVIITCYGERDTDSLLLIKDFVYNSNRLNVAMSRAKKKCIVIMSDNLSKRYSECYEDANEKVVKGTEFICGLKEYMTEDTATHAEDKDGEFVKKDFRFEYTMISDKNDSHYKEIEEVSGQADMKKITIHVYHKGYNKKGEHYE